MQAYSSQTSQRRSDDLLRAQRVQATTCISLGIDGLGECVVSYRVLTVDVDGSPKYANGKRPAKANTSLGTKEQLLAEA